MLRPPATRGAFERLEPRRLLSAYTVVDLGTLGGNVSWAYDLNNSNQVVGYAATASGQDRAFVFSDANANGAADPGETVDLGALPGDAASYAYGISNAGQIVGTSRSVPLGTDGDERAVRFNPGAPPTDFGLGASGNGYSSNASDVNDSAQVVGGTLSNASYVPFLRSAAGAVTTFTLPSPFNSWGEARAINSAGAVAGYSGGPAGDRGFVRSAAGALTPVGHANPALPYSYAWDINDAGAVVGEGFNGAGDYRAFLWQNGSATDLGTLPGMGSSEAYGVNNAGAVVGRVEPPEGAPGATRAFLYRDGAMYDVNDLIPANSGWFIADARAINDRGAIAAVGFSPAGAVRAALLVPTSAVAGRFVFYNRSAFDGWDPRPAASDDAAIAPDKRARIGSAPASFDNVTSYQSGINGIMVDLAGTVSTPDAADFDFGVRQSGSPESWAAAPRPLSVTVRPGAGTGGSDRVTMVWEDGAIRDQWLQVTVRASATTGLWSPDVFSFGNLAGEAVAPPGSGRFVVDAGDVLATRSAIRVAPAAITDRHDFNRDRRVNARDLFIVRSQSAASLTVPPPEGAAMTTSQSTGTTLLKIQKRSALVQILREIDRASVRNPYQTS